jgi:GTP-binding protein EngB required for normal cell division
MNKLFSYFNGNDSLTKIDNSEIFKITNILNNISNDLSINNGIKVPSLVMIGSQSSGKSSLLNKILNMEMLPTGGKMVTRTPLNMELINTKTEFYAEFGQFHNGAWERLRKFKLTSPKPIAEEIKAMSVYIQQLTIERAGNDMNISTNEINVRVYSPHVVNINLIDLPGLTMIACTDKGQPRDIKEQIQNLVKKYIEDPNNIVLCVMPAREDIETDIALEFAKQYDANGSRTIGILTKIDLMNAGADISSYLENNISKDLMVKYGYYAVNNTHIDDYSYFINHPIYAAIDAKDKLGVVHLSNQLSSILLENIKERIPHILTEIDTLYEESHGILANLGTELPTDKDGHNYYLTKFIINLSNIINNSIDGNQEKLNMGREIKDIFVVYRQKLDVISPFSKENCSDEYLVNIIKNSDGNHMSFPIPTIEVLENCLKDNKLRCFALMETPSLECCESIVTIINQLIDTIFSVNSMDRFPKLNKIVVDDIRSELINTNRAITNTKILEMIAIEKNYIWTDEQEFQLILNDISTNLLTIDILRKILTEYYKTFIRNIQNNIPKVIMLFLVKQIQSNIQLLLLNNIGKNNYMSFLIEDGAIVLKRQKYRNIIKNLGDAKSILSHLVNNNHN